MGNNRGNRYSLGHKFLNESNPDDKPAFYEFDFEDMGVKDVPTEIEFILSKTGH
jgi:hypothetical protein